jgi:chemotaxis protein histidine kinase CheA
MQVIQPHHIKVVNELLNLEKGATIEGMLTHMLGSVMQHGVVPGGLLAMARNCQKNSREAKHESKEARDQHKETQRRVYIARQTLNDYKRGLKQVQIIKDAFRVQCKNDEPEEEDNDEPEEEDDDEPEEEDDDEPEEEDNDEPEEEDDDEPEEEDNDEPEEEDNDEPEEEDNDEPEEEDNDEPEEEEDDEPEEEDNDEPEEEDNDEAEEEDNDEPEERMQKRMEKRMQKRMEKRRQKLIEKRMQHLGIIRAYYMQKIRSLKMELEQYRKELGDAQEDKVVAARDHNKTRKAAAFANTVVLMANQLNGLFGLNKPKNNQKALLDNRKTTLDKTNRMVDEARYYVPTPYLKEALERSLHLKVECMTMNKCKGIPEAQAIRDKIILNADSSPTERNMMRVPGFTEHVGKICKANNDRAPPEDQMDASQFAKLMSFLGKAGGVLASVYDVPGGNITGTIKEYCNFLTAPEPPSSSSAPAVARNFPKTIFPGKTTILTTRFRAMLSKAAHLKARALSDHLKEAWTDDKGAEMLVLLLPFLPDFLESLVKEDDGAKSLDVHFKELAPAIIKYQHTIENSFHSKHPGEYCKVGQRCKGGAEKVQLHFAWLCCKILVDCLSAPSSMYGMKRQPAAPIDSSRVGEVIDAIGSDDEDMAEELTSIHKKAGDSGQRAADKFDKKETDRKKREFDSRNARAAKKLRLENGSNRIDYIDLDGSGSGKDSGDGDL